MSGFQINHVTITGNLTRDPELRALPSGTTVCKCRIAYNARRKDGDTGEWVDVPNFFDVVIFGALGERFAEQASKGEKAAFDGTLRWREWDTQAGEKRQASRSSPPPRSGSPATTPRAPTTRSPSRAASPRATTTSRSETRPGGPARPGRACSNT